MADLTAAPASTSAHRRRRGIKMDMTPMVDVAFLLLTFFMLTAVFSQPLAMEINHPPPNGDTEVGRSKLAFPRLDAEGQAWGSFADAVPERLADAEATAFLRDVAQRDLGLVVQTAPGSPYGRFIDALDAVDQAGLTRYQLAALSAEDAARLR
ncbi:MAG: biopolymer transporter ExbD [Rhodothermales bacterium]|nr:biopolymer transporter ExbD [Rhodothermales bacterium]